MYALTIPRVTIGKVPCYFYDSNITGEYTTVVFILSLRCNGNIREGTSIYVIRVSLNYTASLYVRNTYKPGRGITVMFGFYVLNNSTLVITERYKPYPGTDTVGRYRIHCIICVETHNIK